MTEQHPITPPPELVEQWCNNPRLTWLERLSLAYAAGADQELEACCEWTSKYLPYLGDFPLPKDKLRAARRPKPPSLKEQALNLITNHECIGSILMTDDIKTIRLALEQLDD